MITPQRPWIKDVIDLCRHIQPRCEEGEAKPKDKVAESFKARDKSIVTRITMRQNLSLRT